MSFHYFFIFITRIISDEHWIVPPSESTEQACQGWLLSRRRVFHAFTFKCITSLCVILSLADSLNDSQTDSLTDSMTDKMTYLMIDSQNQTFFSLIVCISLTRDEKAKKWSSQTWMMWRVRILDMKGWLIKTLEITYFIRAYSSSEHYLKTQRKPNNVETDW